MSYLDFATHSDWCQVESNAWFNPHPCIIWLTVLPLSQRHSSNYPNIYQFHINMSYVHLIKLLESSKFAAIVLSVSILFQLNILINMPRSNMKKHIMEESVQSWFQCKQNQASQFFKSMLSWHLYYYFLHYYDPSGKRKQSQLSKCKVAKLM